METEIIIKSFARLAKSIGEAGKGYCATKRKIERKFRN